MKCKLGVPSVPVGESSVGSTGEVNLGEYGIDNLAAQDYGLDRFYASEPGKAFDVGAATGGGCVHVEKSGRVEYIRVVPVQ